MLNILVIVGWLILGTLGAIVFDVLFFDLDHEDDDTKILLTVLVLSGPIAIGLLFVAAPLRFLYLIWND